MKKLIMLAAFAFICNALFGQDMMPQMAPPASPDAEDREDKKDEAEKFEVYPNWIENAVELDGKRYIYFGRKIYRLDSVNVDGTTKLAKIRVAQFDGEISNIVALGKRIYFIEKNGNGTFWGYDGRSPRVIYLEGTQNCAFQYVVKQGQKLEITLRCKDKIEIIEPTKELLDSK
jgi:hypothetical protein